jgi:hypothetical protein
VASTHTIGSPTPCASQACFGPPSVSQPRGFFGWSAVIAAPSFVKRRSFSSRSRRHIAYGLCTSGLRVPLPSRAKLLWRMSGIISLSHRSAVSAYHSLRWASGVRVASVISRSLDLASSSRSLRRSRASYHSLRDRVPHNNPLMSPTPTAITKATDDPRTSSLRTSPDIQTPTDPVLRRWRSSSRFVRSNVAPFHFGSLA